MLNEKCSAIHHVWKEQRTCLIDSNFILGNEIITCIKIYKMKLIVFIGAIAYTCVSSTERIKMGGVASHIIHLEGMPPKNWPFGIALLLPVLHDLYGVSIRVCDEYICTIPILVVREWLQN